MRVTVAGVDRSASFQPSELEAISITLMASEGQPGLGTCPVPDDAGTWEPYAGQQFRLDVDDVDIIDGFAGALTRDRQGVVSSTRLVDTITVADENVELNGYRAITWSRPAETDRARVLAFNAAFLAHLSLDTTWVLNTHTVTVPAKKYTRTESIFAELQDDLAKPTGKEMFIERGRLHWHLPTEGITSDMAIVLAEDEDRIDSFTCRSANPPERSKDPMDLATDVVAINTKGETASATDATAITRHDADGLRHQRLVEEPDASPGLLTSIAAAYLLEHKAERITYEGEIGPMTAEQVERIPVGCLINVTDKVWGLTSSTQRIASETIRYIHPDLFMVKVELGYPIRTRARPPKTTPPPRVTPFVCSPTDFAVPWNDVGRGGGYVQILDPTFSGEQLASTIDTPGGGGTFHAYAGATYRVTVSGWPLVLTTDTFDSVYGFRCPTSEPSPGVDVYPWAVVRNGDTRLSCWPTEADADARAAELLATQRPSGSDPFPPGSPPTLWGWLVAVGVQSSGGVTTSFDMGGPPNHADAELTVAGGNWTVASTDDYNGFVHAVNTISYNSYLWASDIQVSYVSGPDPRFEGLGPCSNGEPDAGQPVIDVDLDPTDDENGLEGDGVTATGTTNWPYRPGSLNVHVNGIDWTAQLTETDPTTGEYTLAYPPPLGSTVRRLYLAAP